VQVADRLIINTSTQIMKRAVFILEDVADAWEVDTE